MNYALSRRDVLGAVVAGGTAAMVGLNPFAFAMADRSSRRVTHKRHSVFTPEGKRMLELYAIAVRRMRLLPISDRVSWKAQVNIHQVQMEHSSWWFLPWHRAYLWYFEWIVRETIKDKLDPGENFAMPYWPWEDSWNDAATGKSFRKLPPEFRDPNSSLYDSKRAQAMNIAPDLINDRDDAAPLDIDNEVDRLMELCRFVDESGFGGSLTYSLSGDETLIVAGELEVAHNVVHDQVGGSGLDRHMSNLMVSPDDPIFWVHHSNVDRLWELWRSWGGTRENPDGPEWKNSLHPSGTGWFYPADNPGTIDHVSGEEFLPGFARFDYEYAPYANPAPLGPKPCDPVVALERREAVPGAADLLDTVFAGKRVLTLAGGACQRVHVNAGPTTLEVAPDQGGKLTLEKLVGLAKERQASPVRVEIVVTGVHAAGPPGCTFRVFVNNQDVNAETSSRSPNYVGTISLLNLVSKSMMAHDDHRMPVKAEDEEFRFDISPLVFAKPGDKPFELNRTVVTIVPVGPKGTSGSNTEVSIAGVEIRAMRRLSLPAGAPARPVPGGGPRDP